ncbi:D-alanine--D-alanine ligase [Pedobacter antarcticus]|uniref:D-alanine--D-alanine ligase n=2 Tax=Pedobacter antarcticus TaxID=34086 RepID=A0A081PKW5_9SPHI|nr:D-alanine--D-alanine ligase [Pedobacter antarcticus]KEQ31338.1 D-alanine--D-alanine ligase [Pedobacter antarcticus 4BY]SDL47494.1 D-alanine-D-alanine ligase [Pedobacter antarcticus]SFE37454.1 D-alanine-D-alanine ligase [Pedobacter antarcticus]
MKKIIALLTGGTTNEWVISVKSAATIAHHLDTDKFEVYKIMLTQQGWFYEPADSVKIEVDKNDFSLHFNGRKVTFDGVFIAIHGAPGEDGKLQGYFDMLHIPYTTCDALTSAVTMNKGYTKAIVNGISDLFIARSMQLFKHMPVDLSSIKEELTLPYFVKPNNGGSSIGMSKVKNQYDLKDAIAKAFKEDDQLLIEEFISGREFTVGVVKLDGKIVVLPATEVETAKEFFDFDAKYTPGVATETTPAPIRADTRARVEKIATAVYEKLNCRGVVRIDFILTGDEGDFYFIEINTIPGQTATSFIPQQVAAHGMDLKTFYSKLIKETIS